MTDTTITYRNIHNGAEAVFASPMRDDILFADTTGVWEATFGVEGQDGMYFDPRHWRAVG